MSTIFSENFSIYLKNLYDYPFVISKYQQVTSNVFDTIKKNNGVDLSFGKNTLDYPKYQNDIQHFSKLHLFNIQKIRESSLDNPDDLLKVIENKHIYLKSKYDKYPINEVDLLNDISIQKTYYSKYSEVYNYKKYFLNNYNIPDYDNYLYNMIGQPCLDDVENIDFFQMYYLFFFLTTNMQKFSNIMTQTNDYLICNNHLSDIKVKASFNDFITKSDKEFSSVLSQVVLKNIYSMISPSKTLLTLIDNSILDTIDELKTSFSDFINISYNDPIFNITKLFNDTLIHSMSYELINKLYSDDTFLSQVLPSSGISSITEKEEVLMKKYTDLYDQYSVRQYLYVLFLYKYYPSKFINLIPMITKEYVENEILDIDELYLTDHQIANSLYEFSTKLVNTDNLAAFLNNNFTIDTIFKNIKDQKICAFVISTFYSSIIERFIDSNQCHKFIETLLFNIYDVLCVSGYVERRFNYHTGFKAIKFAISSFLKNGIFSYYPDYKFSYVHIQSDYSNTIEVPHQLNATDIKFIIVDSSGDILTPEKITYTDNNNVIIKLKDVFKGNITCYPTYKLFDILAKDLLSDIDKCLHSTINIIENEKLIGRLDKYNQTFSTIYPFHNDGEFKLFINGIEIASSKYTKFGNYKNIVLSYIPEITDVLTCTYQPEYNINFNITSVQMNKHIINFCTNKSCISNSFKFIKNMLLGSVTKDVMYRIMSYYVI